VVQHADAAHSAAREGCGPAAQDAGRLRDLDWRQRAAEALERGLADDLGS
jgi:hypothetical protein